MSKPPHLDPEYANRFKLKSVAEIYEYRAPYSAEVHQTLLSLMAPEYPIVLDAGCGPGKLARELAPKVERVDAVDFSAEMIQAGQKLPGGTHPHIIWQCSPIETAELQPQYGLMVAGASMQWMDWDVVLPRLSPHLAQDGFLALVSGDGPFNAPWAKQRKALIATYSTMRKYQEFDMIKHFESQGLFKLEDIKVCDPIEITQTVEDFLKAEHSRSSLSIEAMTPKLAAEFDDKYRELLEPYTKDGRITYSVTTTIKWGKPL